MSQKSSPLFTEDRLRLSTQYHPETHVPSEASAVMMSTRPGSHSTVDYSTKGDPDQQVQSPETQLTPEQQWIVSTQNYLLPGGFMTFQPMSCIPTQTFYSLVMQPPDRITKTREHLRDNNLAHGHG